VVKSLGNSCVHYRGEALFQGARCASVEAVPFGNAAEFLKTLVPTASTPFAAHLAQVEQGPIHNALARPQFG
jgi:hypothetical protein